MNEQEILKNNKLIAVFMGAYVNGHGQIISGTVYLSSDSLQYHKDWNLLMPAVEKIESLINISGVTICNNICRIDTPNDELQWERLSTKIESVYSAVVKFIEWHNSQKSVTSP